METPDQTKINGWTVNTLKEYIETRFEDRETALRDLSDSNRTAIELVAAANLRAINLAAEDLGRQLASFNQRFDDMAKRLALIEGSAMASTRYIGWIIAAASVLISATILILSRIH